LENLTGGFIYKRSLHAYEVKLDKASNFKKIPKKNENIKKTTDFTYFISIKMIITI